MSTNCDRLREIASAAVADITAIDAHLKAVAELVEQIEERWRVHQDAGGDPRLQRRYFGRACMRFKGELAALTVNRLTHLVRAEYSPFEPVVKPERALRDAAMHDVVVIEMHLADVEAQDRRFG